MRLGELEKKLVGAYRESVRDYDTLILIKINYNHRLREKCWRMKDYLMKRMKRKPVPWPRAYFHPL